MSLSIQKSSAKIAPLPIYKSAAKLFRQPKALPLPIQKSTAKLCRCLFRNHQQKLRQCRFINRQPNCATADSEIDSQKLCRCRF
jgi:hypothetical protein